MFILSFTRTSLILYKIVAGSPTTLISDLGSVVSNGDTVRLEIAGSLLQVVVNGVVIAGIIDGEFAAAGKAGYGAGAIVLGTEEMDQQIIDDFEAIFFAVAASVK